LRQRYHFTLILVEATRGVDKQRGKVYNLAHFNINKDREQD